jgi:SAM-dependent methyltransferase
MAQIDVGSATTNGTMWSARARDWADIMEPANRLLFDSALEAARIRPQTRFLDVGCGSGLVAHLAAERGALVSGLDAAEAFVEIARERTPHGDFRVGEMEDLPFADGEFDVVAAFNSMQFAANAGRAMREAARVGAPAATFLLALWGDPERAAWGRLLRTAMTHLGVEPPPRGAPEVRDEMGLQALAAEADLSIIEVGRVDCVWEFPDETTALRGSLSPGPMLGLSNNLGEDRVRTALATAFQAYRSPDGSYRMTNEFVFCTARR